MPLVQYEEYRRPLASYGAIDYDAPALADPANSDEYAGLLATAKSSFASKNMIVSGVSSALNGVSLDEKDGLTGREIWDMIRGTRYEAAWSSFARVHNRTALEAMFAQIDMEEENRRVRDAAGWVGVGTDIAAQLFDLPTLLPGGAAVRGVSMGRSVVQTGLRTAAAGALASSVSEIGLQATQETLPISESLTNIGEATILSGLLGAGAGAVFSTLERRSALRAIREAQDKAPEIEVAADALDKELREISLQSAGAAAVRPADLEDFSIAGRAGSAVAKATAPLNPLLRTLHSPSAVVRDVASRLMGNPVYLRKNMEGEGEFAAETAMQEYARGALVRALEKQERAFLEARKAGTDMTFPEFQEAVGRAMRRNDESNIPGVSEAAQAWREHVINPLKERAIENGQLPADVSVTTADSYFSRMWNRLAIEANLPKFRNIVRGWLSGELEKEVRRVNARADASLMNIQREINDLEIGILRRDEMAARGRAEGLSDVGIAENDVVSFVRRVEAGERPPEVESLSQWFKRQKSGVFDPGGDILQIFPEARSIPGLMRKSMRTKANQRGGDGLDEISRRAWEEGFLEGVDRPTVRDFLDALDEDLRGSRRVRSADADKARMADDFDSMMRALDRAGVDFKRPLFGTTDDMARLAARVNRVLGDLDREKIGGLRNRAAHHTARKLGDFVSDADRDAYLNEIVDDIVANLTGRAHDGRMPGDLTINARGPLAGRTFGIPDELVEDFLESNAEIVGRRYARMMAADVSIAEKFGTADMKFAMEEIVADYGRLRERVERDPSLSADDRRKAMKALATLEKRDLEDIEGVRDLLRGNYRPEIQHTTFARIGKAANVFNTMRAMGSVVRSSLGDVVRPAMVHGLTAYMRDGIVPLVKNLKAVKLSVEEAKTAGAISERWLQSRLATLAELTDPYASASPFERFLDNTGSLFMKMTGLAIWTDFQKSFSAVLTQTRILRNAETALAKGFDSLPKGEQAYMGFLGLGRDRVEDLARLFQQHGETIDGVKVANSERWGNDPVAAYMRRAWRAAINKDTDSIVVTKGAGDVPLIMNTPIGKSLGQFKSFALAANQRVLIRGLQEDKARFVGGVLGMSAVGMFITWLAAIETGRALPNNPGTWAMEGLDRSGVMPVMFEVNNMLEKAGAPLLYTGAANLGRLFDPEAGESRPASRYASRGVPDALMGPTFGGAVDAAALLSMGFGNLRKVSTGEAATITPADIDSAARLTPFRTLPYWRWAIDGFLIPEMKKDAGG